MTTLDFIVIGAYAVGMLAIGRYFGRRTENTEQYLLGGRSMGPLMIGLSLFATLNSTLSYLALPSELIGHGPMVFAQLVSYPVVALIVGWLLIPAIMKVRATSAYELLETRLGVSGRLLGASMFVVLRLIWMAAILYATSDVVLIPLLGLPSTAMPWTCAILGLMTVVYTTAGGLRAVVVTDALQSIIMFMGASACIAVVSLRLGGFDAWWPQTWHSHWDELTWWDASAAHIPIVGAFVNMLVWMMCTAGSDQMAVQRYLATRDTKAARRSFNISLIADIAVQIMLAMAGLAVLAYAMAYPTQFPTGTDVVQDADELFPRFIVVGLPSGLSGLLIAAILSAAMSSLSSGVNSSCAVIVTDFMGRFRSASMTSTNNLRLARCVSIAIGAMFVLLSMLMGQVSGNLLELCYKVVNLLTAPLFVLFFLAIFVPWATPLGAFAATAAGITVGVGVSFGDWFGLGFLWMGFCSLLTGVVVGMVVSLLPASHSGDTGTPEKD